MSAYVALGLALFSAYLYLGVYLTDRRRTAYGWFALTGLSGALYPLFETAIAQRFLGPWEVTVAGVGLSIALVTNMHFTRAYFGLPPPPRAWLWTCALACAVSISSTGYFSGTRLTGIASIAIIVPAILTQVLLLLRFLRSSSSPVDVAVVLAGWPFAAVVATPDFLAWLGFGERAGGLHGGSLAIAAIGMLQTVALSRAHTRSLLESESLARERGERLQQFEHLNEELRRQVAARSRQLADVLAGLGGERADLSPGVVVEGRYRVVRVLGAGAGGTVYLVERMTDGASFALKVVLTRGDAHALSRLAREAQLAAEVKDSHVVSIVDVDIAASGFLYIVMEYVPGGSLRDARARYGDVSWALPILRQIAEGLTAIHAHGVVHRDLKPANVLLVAGGATEPVSVKIADFGIARGSERAGSATVSTRRPQETTVREANPRLTMTGMILGTPLYMAPETIDGARDVTAAVDVFAFGVIAYEILSGRVPFRDSPALAQLDGLQVPPPPPLAASCPEVPPALAAIVTRCLSFDPAARPSAADLASALSGPPRAG